ncbi:MAG: primosomal protein N' [Armatimonadetes bacterium]|nr:primosomal protein N' [Armatimonadota bacterium]
MPAPSPDHVVVADVSVLTDAQGLLPTYTYRVPQGMVAELAVGVCVHVPFGRGESVGYVLGVRGIGAQDPPVERLMCIMATAPDSCVLTPDRIALARAISHRWLTDLGSAISCVAPHLVVSATRRVYRLVWDRSDMRLLGAARTQDASILDAVERLLDAMDQAEGALSDAELRRSAPPACYDAAMASLVHVGAVVREYRLVGPAAKAKTLGKYAMAPDWTPGSARLGPAMRRVLDAARQAAQDADPWLDARTLAEMAGSTPAVVRSMAERGALLRTTVSVRRAPGGASEGRNTAPALTASQTDACRALADDGGHRRFLLHGVTASGKTEVYLDAIARGLERGRGSVVLLPEIALTAQALHVFTARFGDEVAILHSALTPGEWHDEWRRLESGEARIAVGARSAVFAPVNDLGLVIVDEEHESSYKQDKAPRYHARDVAEVRAGEAGARLILGSATPSVETYYAAQGGRFTLLEMQTRVGDRAMPEVRVVDMRSALRAQRTLFSPDLTDGIGARLTRGEQTILFLNRRGYSPFLLCRDCGHVPGCPNCAVAMTYHAGAQRLRCHHCDHGERLPVLCPECRGASLKGFGVGTERVEEEIQRLFPAASVARMDRDTTGRKGAHAEILGRFRSGEADILIGTQMVAKGLDFPGVTLVGVINADTTLHVPDFRASERTFQLLAQVAGRAGRGTTSGEVLIQTFAPEHTAVQAAARHDYAAFYGGEIEARRELLYPPFSRLANLVCQDKGEAAAQSGAEAVAGALRDAAPSEAEVLGPAPAPLAKLNTLYRWHALLRTPPECDISEVVARAMTTVSSGLRRALIVDIDPQSMA